MDPKTSHACTAFAGSTRIAAGSPPNVAAACKRLLDSGDTRILSVFDDQTAQPLELDLRGTVEDVVLRLTPDDEPAEALNETMPAKRSPGRPKLGVVGREVTLLPRHWAWLGAQPGGASVALRKLVEQALRQSADSERERRSREAVFRFMSAIAGNEPGYEEATRALFAGDEERFAQQTELWPTDVRDYARMLAADAFPQET